MIFITVIVWIFAHLLFWYPDHLNFQLVFALSTGLQVKNIVLHTDKNAIFILIVIKLSIIRFILDDGYVSSMLKLL